MDTIYKLEVLQDLPSQQIVEQLSNLLYKYVDVPPNRVLICTPNQKEDKVSSSGLYIPKTLDDKDLPKKGVVLLRGHFDEEYMPKILHVGDIVTFGMYGGKEVSFEQPINSDELFAKYKDKFRFAVLSFTEVMLIERYPNNNN